MGKSHTVVPRGNAGSEAAGSEAAGSETVGSETVGTSICTNTRNITILLYFFLNGTSQVVFIVQCGHIDEWAKYLCRVLYVLKATLALVNPQPSTPFPKSFKNADFVSKPCVNLYPRGYSATRQAPVQDEARSAIFTTILDTMHYTSKWWCCAATTTAMTVLIQMQILY